jgi:hypothetical protein
MESEHFLFKEVDPNNPLDRELLDDFQGSGHPDVHIPGFTPTYNLEVDDVDILLREFVTLMPGFPKEWIDTDNGSEFVVNEDGTGAEGSFYFYENRKSMEAVVTMKGKFMEYASKEDPHYRAVCFVIELDSILIEEIKS